MILRVGLTGGIASGKSTIRRMFAALGCGTVDADAIVADLYRPGAAGHAALLRTYGPEILLADGAIDRKRLADIAFSAPEQAQKLNALIHPLVIEQQAAIVAEAEASGEEIFVVEATLLLESGGRTRFDRVVVVDVAPDVQLARALGRGLAREEALRRIANQMPREQRLAQADYVIDNNGDEAHAREETRRVYAELRRDLERMRG